MPPPALLFDARTGRGATHGRVLVLTRDVLALLSQLLPPDAFCLLGITPRDLYPDPSWNFVFGEASLKDRVGVYSFARYDPRFLVGRFSA